MQRAVRTLVMFMMLVVAGIVARGEAQAGGEAGPLAGELQARVRAVDALGPDRSVGTPAAQEAAEFWARQLQGATGQKVWRQRFRLAAPSFGYAEAILPTTGTQPAGTPATSGPAATAPATRFGLWPLTPAGGQIPSLPGNQLTAPVVYAGRGTLDELHGKPIAGSIVALDVASQGAWQTVGALGAKAVILLGNADTTVTDLLDKWTPCPVGVPRFYSDDAALAAGLAAGRITALTLRASTPWREVQAENLLCLIPGRHAGADQNGWSDQLVVLLARYDASSQVIGRSPGATNSANAAALVELARRISELPSRCSTLIVLTAGDEWMYRGTRNFLDLLRREDKTLAGALKQLNKLASETDTAATTADEVVAGLERMAASRDRSALAKPSVRAALRDHLDRRTSAIEEQLQAARLAAQTPAGKLDETLGHQIEQLNSRKMLSLSASVAVNRQTQLEASAKLIQDAARDLLPFWRREQTRRRAEQQERRTAIEIRKAIGDRSTQVIFELAFTSGNDRFGFFPRSFFTQQNDYVGRLATCAKFLVSYDAEAREAATKSTAPATAVGRLPAFDTTSRETTYTIESFLPIKRGFSTDMAMARGIPAGALATVRDTTGLLDTPNDTPDRLRWDNLCRQIEAAYRILLGNGPSVGVLTDPFFEARADISNNTANQQVRVFERTLGETIPRIGAPEHLVGGELEKFNNQWVPALQGVRRMDWTLTYVDGSATFLSMPKYWVKLHAYRFGPDGVANRAISQVQADQKGLVSGFTADPSRPQRLMVFDCQRLDLLDIFDQRYVDTLDRVQLLDARRLDAVAYSSNFVRDGLGAVFMPPKTTWQLLMSKGEIANRMVLINADEKHPDGQGFSTVDLAEIGPLSWRNALDMYYLNSRRKKNLENFGISNELIKTLHGEAKAYIDQGRQARDHRDYATWLGDAAAAWSYESQVYNNLISTSNGIIYGVIFLLVGIIPFSYFLERLLIGSTNVYRQILGFAVIFVLMTAALWFHPAFRISSAPIMILLAFLILILSSTVVYILWGRFEEEIARLRGAGSASHSASLSRGAVLGAAVRLGLSNMRRRMMRTVLTLVTLVLLTFTLLCFTSVSEALRLTPQVVDNVDSAETPAKGIELRQRAWRNMYPFVQTLVRQVAGPGGKTAERYWIATQSADLPWQLPITPTDTAGSACGKPFLVAGLVGLEADEALFHTLDIATILPGWDRLAAGQPVCLLPQDAQRDAGLKVGDRVQVVGEPLTVAGFYDPKDFLKLRHFTGDELTPVDPKNATAAPTALSSTSPEDLVAIAEQSYAFLNPANVAVIPASTARRLGGRLTSIMILPADASKIIPVAEDLAKRSAFAVFASDGTQVRSFNAAASSRPENLDTVLIPMIIAGVIVLNTMLGAVAERTREIHVYTSLGLAPAHVGTLFLAEAAALGTLGVVFGYIFGQGLATVLSHLSLMQGVDLNYSSLAAIVTMGLVLGLVMLSSVWPARSASRVAAPSLDRHWHLPRAEGDILTVDLPFTVNDQAARGVCAFLDEFLLTTSQAGTGRFTADNIRTFYQNHGSAGGTRGLTCRIWLAPYDLGVIQTLWLAIHPTVDANVYEVRLTLVREAGSPTTWYRLNRPFLVEIRKQFLLWRAVKPEMVQVYVQRSEAMFADAQAILPPVAAPLGAA